MKQGLLVKGTAVRILALDLGKFKMVACNCEEGDDRFEAVGTQRAELSGLWTRKSRMSWCLKPAPTLAGPPISSGSYT